MPQTLTEIRALLQAHDLRPKKRFGQNFLHDQRQMARILQIADIQPGQLILEVGAGTGALSVAMLEAGANLLTVEVDRDLEPILRQVLEPFEHRAQLVIGDVLAGKHHLNPLVLQALNQSLQAHGQNEFKLVANLPYNVASPLLVNLALSENRPRSGVVMVQKEVALRLEAGPGGKDFGPLGIMMQAVFEVRRAATLAPGCFWPAPKVESALVTLHRRATPLCADLTRLSTLVHRLFNQRRKQIGSLLGRDYPLPAGITPTLRPEQLTIAQLALLAG
ncbi:MAG: ribosomal RNA small subunit methyltransferase A [Phycisphaeraceae bacterium]|nr:ribosomal RNA small subunit methyltransferase A [Phycisphaeraceae bacterium]